MTRRRVLAAGGASVGAAVAGCVGGSSDGGTTDGDGDGGSQETTGGAMSTATAETLASVTYRNRYKRVGIATGMNDAAVEMGLWESEGVDVSFKPSTGTTAAAKSVASGNDMFGNGETSGVLPLMEQEDDLVIIAQHMDPLQGVVTRGDNGITDWADLEGTTVGVNPYGGINMGKVAMRREGVDLSTVTFRNVQPGQEVQVLVEGAVDAMIKWLVLLPPRLRAQGHSPNVLPTTDVLDLPGVTLFTRRQVVENKPDVVDAFVRGWLQANRTFATDVDRVFEVYDDIASKYYDAELNRKALPTFYSALVPSKSVGEEHGKGWVSPSEIQGLVDILDENDVIEGSLDPETTFTNRFIERNQDLAIETATDIYDRLAEYDVGPDFV